MNNCFYCEKGNTLSDLMLLVCELEHANVYLVKNQNFPYRCVVALKEHKAELFDLSKEQLCGFSAEVALVSKAVFELADANKINYGIYGDKVPHLHYHIVPKREGEFCWGSPFLLQGNDIFPDAAELERRIQQIQQKIKELTACESL